MYSQLSFRRIHFVGIKGAGMAALAQVLHAHHVRVTGSDTKEVFFTDEFLHRAGISFFEHFSKDNIPADVDAIVYSTAYHPEVNEELIVAKERGVPLFSYPEFLGQLAKHKLAIAVAGTHGKTTTTAMLAHVLLISGKDPSAVVGSRVVNWQGGALSGTGPHFIFEADEYQNKFVHYRPWSLVLTNVDYDHPDFFPTTQDYEKVFETFASTIPAHGWIIACADSTGALRVTEKVRSHRLTYGYHKDSDYQIEDQDTASKSQPLFSVRKKGRELGMFRLRLLGHHNIQNATAVIAMADVMGIPMEDVKRALFDFHGTARRLERKGVYRGALVFDDYAHHPDEISATLRAVRKAYPEKECVIVFQPHTYSRTQEFLNNFSESLAQADAVLLLDIYSSAREVGGNVSSDDLSKKINEISPEKSANIHSLERAVDLLKKSADKNTIILTMGAGDVWKVGESLLGKK